MTVAALFVRKNSIYKTMTGVDAWDKDRDARNWPGGPPVIAHPPCAQWGTFSHMAKHDAEEKFLAPLAVDLVRKWHGVLEHPVRSKLWRYCRLPLGPVPDEFGGWTLTVSQRWWGHLAEKQTRLYIVGCDPKAIPAMPLMIGRAQFICGGGAAHTNRAAKHRHQCPPEFRRRSISHADREHTPLAFAQWLVELAERCKGPG